MRNEGNQKYIGGTATPAVPGRSQRPTVGVELAGSLAAAVQLARLRNKLSDYYAGEGRGSALRIRVPDEGYQVSVDMVAAAGPAHAITAAATSAQ